ncbi:MAG: hypothetical protein VKJ24_09405 [Synechococcales bacterium]|nr:hypothetical protein [Synechococcales bacterium]
MAELWIDLTDAGLDLEAEELEAYTLRLAEELRQDLAEDAGLVRQTEVPEGAMSGAAEFILGILKAEVSVGNLLAVLKWLWELRPNTVLKLSYKEGDREVSLEYHTQAQLNQQLEALKQIEAMKIQIIQVKAP